MPQCCLLITTRFENSYLLFSIKPNLHNQYHYTATELGLLSARTSSAGACMRAY